MLAKEEHRTFRDDCRHAFAARQHAAAAPQAPQKDAADAMRGAHTHARSTYTVLPVFTGSSIVRPVTAGGPSPSLGSHLAMVAKELAHGYSVQTNFFVLEQAKNAAFVKAFERNNSSLQMDQKKKLRAAHAIYFSASKKIFIITPENAGAHAMGVIGVVGNRIEFFYTVRPFFFGR